MEYFIFQYYFNNRVDKKIKSRHHGITRLAQRRKTIATVLKKRKERAVRYQCQTAITISFDK